jgi:hypothetical protein
MFMQVSWLKVELCKLLEEKRSADLRFGYILSRTYVCPYESRLATYAQYKYPAIDTMT